MSCGEVQMYQAYYPYLYQRAAAAGAAASGGSVPPPAAHHRHHTHPHTPTPSSSGHHHGSFGSPTTGSPFAPATAHQYDRFNVQRSLSDNPQPSTSSLGLPSDLYLHSSAAHLSAAATSSTSVVQSSLHHHSGTVSGSGILAHSATSASASHSSAGSVSSPGGAGQGGGGGGNTTSGISPAPSPIRSAPLGQHKVEEDVSLHERSSTEGPGVDEDDDDSCQGLGSSCTSRAQYVSANCVVFTHYTGDAATVVDQHFSRALDKSSPSHGKDTSPMSARNFPPSFWNSHYQPPPSASGSLSHHMSSADLYSTDPYHPAAVHTTGDPWHTHYQQYTAAAAHHHHRAVHDYHHHHGTAAAAMAHQAAAYSGLLLAPPPSARLSHHHLHQAAAASQCKAGPGPGDWQHHQTSHLDTATAAAYAATYPTMAGLEAQVQESSKDLYWF
ncbi:protein vestigial [Chrysoperla carnea]|uniref:protein vestigial n=1 Tax=Chrysoperla carnea TaxID=189513 RepID=UPI001D0677F0|nr:protein vestigial [Chrysoperla carnea]